MLVCKIRFTHNITNRKMILVVTEKQIFHIEDTNHVVGRIFIDWQPGKLILLKNLNQLIVGTVYLRKGHIDSRNHDFFGLCIAKIKHIVNHGVFFRLDDAGFLADIHDCAQFFLGHLLGIGIRINAE